MAGETVRQQIQEIREFFNTITAGTPAAINAMAKINRYFDSFLGVGPKLQVTTGALDKTFNTIARGSRKAADELNVLKERYNSVFSKIEKMGNLSRLSVLPVSDPKQLASYKLGNARDIGGKYDFNALINKTLAGEKIKLSSLTQLMGPSGVFADAGLAQTDIVNKVIPGIKMLLKEYSNYPAAGKAAAAAQKVLNQQLATFQTIIARPGGLEKLQSSLKSIQLATMQSGSKMTMNEYFDKTFGVGGQGIYKKVEEFAKKYRYTMDDIKSITREASTGMARLSFQKETPVVGAGGMATSINMVDKMGVSIDRLGNVARDTQRRFHSFFSGVARDTGEFLKWSIAATLVYAPLQQLSKLMIEMTENQSKLADLQIITNQSSEEVYSSFGKIADVASVTGQSIGDTIDAYKAAYVAAGSITDENERAATATVLLSDSLLLTRLSTLTQAESLDILASALKQVGGQLTDSNNKLLSGSQIIDKWVAVSKVANVSVDTLARSFSIVGSAAEDVGLGIDELNGVIAAVAEVSSLSPTETGNMVRAFISGYQSDEAIKELGKFGIAVTDTEGKVREYMTVMEEVKSLTDAGIISPEQAAKIADTLGGGARRGAQVAQFLDNLNKVKQISVVSDLAQAQAYEALGIKMSTLKGSTQKLGVAFSTLAQSLGQEGGILQSATDAVDIFTALTNKISGLANTLGTALPMLVTFGTAMAFFSANTAAADKALSFLGTAGYSFGSKLARGTRVAGAKWNAPDIPSERFQKTQGFEKISPFLIGAQVPTISGMDRKADEWGSKFATGIIKYLPHIVAGLATLGPATANARQGQWGGAAADVAAGVGGFALGQAALTSMLGPMAGPIGAMIGVAIAEAFVNAVTKDVNLTKGLADAYATALKASLPTTPEEEKANEVQKIESAYEKRFGAATLLSNIISPAFAKEGIVGFSTGQNMTSEQAQLAFTQWLVQVFGGDAGKKANKALVDAISGFINETVATDQDALGKISTLMSKQVSEAESRFGQMDQKIVQEAKDKAIQQMQFGELSGTEFKTQTTALQTLPILTKQIWAAGGDEFQRNLKDVKDADEAYKELSETLFGMTDQEKSLIIQMAGEIAVLEGSNEKKAERIAKEKELGMILASARSGQAIQQVSIPQIADFGKTGYQAAVNTLMKAQKETREYYTQFIDDPIALEKFLADLDEVSARYWKDAGEQSAFAYSEAFGGIDQEILGKVMETAKKAGEIAIKPGDLSIQDLSGVTTGEFEGGIMPNYQAWKSFLDQAFGEQPTEATGIILQDGFKMMDLNMLAFRLAQQKTNELLQEQLDGIYNLPEGMQLWVPSQAAEMSAKTLATGGGGGGYIGPPPLNGEVLTQPTATTVEPTQTQIDFANAIAEETMKQAELLAGYEKPTGQPTGMDFWKELLGLEEFTVKPRERDLEESPLINNLNKAMTPGLMPDPLTFWTPLTSAFEAFTSSIQPIFDAFKADTNTKPVTKSDITVNTTNNFNVDGLRLATYVKRLIARDLTGYGGSKTISSFMS